MEEAWRPISAWEGYYEVSNHGRVRSCDRLVQHAKGGMALKNGRLLKLRMDGKGYPFVGLYRSSKGKQERVHRLVAQAFIPNPLGLPHVNHMDGNKANPMASNLEWSTHSKNMCHARDVLNRWTTGYHEPRSPRNPKLREAA
jgi:L-2-hydroxyglutarate oxidase LhgO